MYGIPQNGRHCPYQKNVVMTMLVEYGVIKWTLEKVIDVYSKIDYKFMLPANRLRL